MKENDPLLQLLRDQYRRTEQEKMQPPLSADEALAMAKRRQGPTPYRRLWRDAVVQWLMAVALVAACGLLLHIALKSPIRWLPAAAMIASLPALWQLTAASRRLFLLWHLAPARHAPMRHARYALRLQRLEERRLRLVQRLSRLPRRTPTLRPLLLHANSLALGICLLLCAGLWQPPLHSADGTKSSAYVLCNGDCAKLQLMDEVGGLFARA